MAGIIVPEVNVVERGNGSARSDLRDPSLRIQVQKPPWPGGGDKGNGRTFGKSKQN